MENKKILLGVIAVTILVSTGVVKATNLLTNGGFESPEVTNPAGWDVFCDGTEGLYWHVEKYDDVWYNTSRTSTS